MDGKLLRVGVAEDTIKRLVGLEPKEFALQLYGSALNKQLVADPVGTLEKYLEDDGVTLNDKLTKAGRSFPPFHPNCRTRMEGVIAGAGKTDGESQQ